MLGAAVQHHAVQHDENFQLSNSLFKNTKVASTSSDQHQDCITLILSPFVCCIRDHSHVTLSTHSFTSTIKSTPSNFFFKPTSQIYSTFVPSNLSYLRKFTLPLPYYLHYYKVVRRGRCCSSIG